MHGIGSRNNRVTRIIYLAPAVPALDRQPGTENLESQDCGNDLSFEPPPHDVTIWCRDDEIASQLQSAQIQLYRFCAHILNAHRDLNDAAGGHSFRDVQRQPDIGVRGQAPQHRLRNEMRAPLVFGRARISNSRVRLLRGRQRSQFLHDLLERAHYKVASTAAPEDSGELHVIAARDPEDG